MTKPERVPEAEAIARRVLATHFGVAEAKLTYQERGLSNYVFEADIPGGPVVLRIGPAARQRERFTRERCVIEQVREAGIPVPEIIEQGEENGWAYMAVHRMAGEPATDHPARLDILRETARLAAGFVHQVPTGGFGPDFALEGRCGGGQMSWRGWLDEGLDAFHRLDLLRTREVVDSGQLDALKDTLENVRQWDGPSVLQHGDLRFKNVLVDGDGAIVGLIDWEGCVSSTGPHWDLSIALHDLSIDEKEAFLDGYGLSGDQVREFAPVWRLFNALNYAPRVDRLSKLNDGASLEQVRIRFSGALDLFAA
jgi:aminoglycoside phosphotransferase (APT) family kinase protein